MTKWINNYKIVVKEEKVKQCIKTREVWDTMQTTVKLPENKDGGNGEPNTGRDNRKELSKIEIKEASISQRKEKSMNPPKKKTHKKQLRRNKALIQPIE